jgi:hypothetical protein
MSQIEMFTMKFVTLHIWVLLAEPKRPVLKERKPLFVPDETTCGYAPAAYGTTG